MANLRKGQFRSGKRSIKHVRSTPVVYSSREREVPGTRNKASIWASSGVPDNMHFPHKNVRPCDRLTSPSAPCPPCKGKCPKCDEIRHAQEFKKTIDNVLGKLNSFTIRNGDYYRMLSKKYITYAMVCEYLRHIESKKARPDDGILTKHNDLYDLPQTIMDDLPNEVDTQRYDEIKELNKESFNERHSPNGFFVKRSVHEKSLPHAPSMVEVLSEERHFNLPPPIFRDSHTSHRKQFKGHFCRELSLLKERNGQYYNSKPLLKTNFYEAAELVPSKYGPGIHPYSEKFRRLGRMMSLPSLEDRTSFYSSYGEEEFSYLSDSSRNRRKARYVDDSETLGEYSDKVIYASPHPEMASWQLPYSPLRPDVPRKFKKPWREEFPPPPLARRKHGKARPPPYPFHAFLEETGDLAFPQVGDDLLGGVVRGHQLHRVDEPVQLLQKQRRIM